MLRIEGLEKVKKILNTDVPDRADDIVAEGARVFDQIANKEITDKVYDRPVSPNYIRTGRARRGRRIRSLGKAKRLHIMDSKIAGADRGYSAALNRNRRIRVNNTEFWDDAVDEFKDEIPSIVKKNKILRK